MNSPINDRYDFACGETRIRLPLHLLRCTTRSFELARDQLVRVRVLEQTVEAVSDRLCPPAGDVPARTLNCRPKSAIRARSDQPTARRGGAEETRTPDFLLAKEALYQLSYGPWFSACGRFWTRTRDLCLIRAVL